MTWRRDKPADGSPAVSETAVIHDHDGQRGITWTAVDVSQPASVIPRRAKANTTRYCRPLLPAPSSAEKRRVPVPSCLGEPPALRRGNHLHKLEGPWSHTEGALARRGTRSFRHPFPRGIFAPRVPSLARLVMLGDGCWLRLSANLETDDPSRGYTAEPAHPPLHLRYYKDRITTVLRAFPQCGSCLEPPPKKQRIGWLGWAFPRYEVNRCRAEPWDAW